MAQGDYLIQNQTFPSFRTDLNSTLEAINTSNSGTSRPSSAVAGTVWLDVTNATNPTLKFFDGTDDISLAQFDYSANTVNWLDSTVVFDIVGDTTPDLGGDLNVNGNDIVSVSNGNITFTPDGTGKVIISGLSFPTADGTSGQAIVTDGCGNLSFASVEGRTGTVDWDTTAKTGNFTAVSGNGYFVNTTSTAITLTLPASPSAGDIVSVKDYAYTFETNNLTVARNGSPIGGDTGDNPTYSINGTSKTFVYVDGTKGWLVVNESTDVSTAQTAAFVTATGGTITTSGDYKIHTFTSPGTFCVSAGSGPLAEVDYLVVAGGAGAGFDSGGGGGAGGFRASSGTYTVGCSPASPLISCVSALPVSVQGYPITVGGGGASSSSGSTPGTSGSNSTAIGITSSGGGGGGGGGGASGSDGGSGGGTSGTSGNPGGSGNTPSVSPPQGQPGGIGSGCPSSSGGGGAIVAGESKHPSYGCVGGDGGDGAGVPTAFGTSGESSGGYYYFSGGGGGGPRGVCWCVPGLGGLGGGGDSVNSGAGNAGTANTGGGAGGPSGSSIAQAGAGGSGIVIIRYKFQ